MDVILDYAANSTILNGQQSLLKTHYSKNICKCYAFIIITCACMSSRLPRSWRSSWIYAYFTVFPNVKLWPTCYICSTDPSQCSHQKQYTSFIFLWKASKLKSINRIIYFAFNSNSRASTIRNMSGIMHWCLLLFPIGRNIVIDVVKHHFFINVTNIF